MEKLSKSYTPRGIEEKWYDFWIANGFFEANPSSGSESYSIVIPPPNVTGTLHMGHALNTTLQDILIRWKRMSGYEVLWIPGTDHAGIATQNVVERQITHESLDRHQMGRDTFIDRVWKWRAEYGGKIIHQLKRLGASCDWTRERFTLDEGLSRAVIEVFIKLYEEGLIYRDNRLINWCPRCHTALSDIEVEHEEFDGRLTFIKYPFEEGGGYVTVATTRPETMLGDTAVAVHPSDERYSKSIGKYVELPLTGRKIPIVSDDTVDPQFGSGAVKVTPSHDFNDEAIAKRRQPPLDFIAVIGADGRMTDKAGQKYACMDRYECRKTVLNDLKQKELIVKQEKYSHSVGQCYRCKTVIEPLSTLQWYVKVEPLAKEAIKAVEDERIKIFPKTWDNTYFSWMENIRDWCISRQIWWGHRIPAWYCRENKNDECRNKNGVIVSREEPKECPYCGSSELYQDEDVLDTWFSSALWPFSTLGWPDETPELKKYYPTEVLVTAFDILFFWVARMIMMGIKFMDDVPFRNVYIHALVRDLSGQKMSKSKGNVIDPLVMMEKYGTDAFRFTLTAFAAQGRDIKFSEDRVEGYRHFVNKLWNASRFILSNAQDTFVSEEFDVKKLDISSRWILSRLSAATEEINRSLQDYRFNDAASSIYQFIWHELCDWYIEMVKPVLSSSSKNKPAVQQCLLFVLERTLRLLHPFMPYVTEEIWQNLPRVEDSASKGSVRALPDDSAIGYQMADSNKASSIVVAAYPQVFQRDRDAESEMEIIIEAITGIRTIRGELNLSPSLKVSVHVRTRTDLARDIIKNNLIYIEKLAKSNIEKVGLTVKRPKGSATIVKESIEVYIPLEGILDVDLEIDRLKKEEAKIEKTISFLNKKLLNEDFLNKAPKDVVRKEKERYDACIKKRERNRDNIKKLYEVGVKK
jgi:valyl-tRNA synthetase